jgi:hypothetical protein
MLKVIFILILILLIILINYKYNIENFNTTSNITDDERKIIKELSPHILAIKNLSDLANNLMKDGKLTVPGGLDIQGDITNKQITELYNRTKFWKNDGTYNTPTGGVWSTQTFDAIWNDLQKAKNDINELKNKTQNINANGSTIYVDNLNASNKVQIGGLAFFKGSDGTIYLKKNININNNDINNKESTDKTDSGTFMQFIVDDSRNDLRWKSFIYFHNKWGNKSYGTV